MSSRDPLISAYAAGHPDAFSRILARRKPEDVADALGDLLPGDRVSILARLSLSSIRAVQAGTPDFANAWLAEAPFDRALALLARLPGPERAALIEQIAEPELRQRLRRHLTYPAHAIGNLIVDAPVRIVNTAKTADVIAALQELDTLDSESLVVTSESGDYAGVVNAWRLFLKKPPRYVRDIVDTLPPLRPEMSVAGIVDDDRWETNAWLPVVDQHNRFLGRASRAKVLRAAKDEAYAQRSREQAGADLFAEFVYLLDSVLGNLLGARRTR